MQGIYFGMRHWSPVIRCFLFRDGGVHRGYVPGRQAEDKPMLVGLYDDMRFVFATGHSTPTNIQDITNGHSKFLLECVGLPLSTGTISRSL
jgi:hypothetical protein